MASARGSSLRVALFAMLLQSRNMFAAVPAFLMTAPPMLGTTRRQRLSCASAADEAAPSKGST